MNRSRRSRAVADRADASSDTERLGDLPHAKGTIVWTLCRLDIVLTPYEAATLSAPYQPIVDRYAYTDWEGRVVLCWDHGRYINHSCDPVMVGIGNEIEIAVRDIAAGDQLTCEYATLYPTAMMECRCGSSGCRGGVGLDDLAALWPELDRKGATALTSARSVPQPLLPFVRDAGRFLDWVDGRADRPNRHGRSTGVLRAERTG